MVASRTVRLDSEAEQALLEIQRLTDMSISEALEQGLLELLRRVRAEPGGDPWAVYERIDLGPGGYAPAPSSDAKRAVAGRIRRKHRR